MKKWIFSALLCLIMQGNAMIMASDAQQFNSTDTEFASKYSYPRRPNPNDPDQRGPRGHRGSDGGGYNTFASYWLTYQPSLVAGQNVIFNLPQTLQGIQYDDTTGYFTLPAGVYVLSFFATPSPSYANTLNLVVNGTLIPTPSIEGSTVVVELTADSNQVSVQAIGNWSPNTAIPLYYSAYASFAIFQIGS